MEQVQEECHNIQISRVGLLRVGLHPPRSGGNQRDSPTIWIEYANLTHTINETKDSISLLKQGLKANKDHLDILCLLGAYYVIQKDVKNAKKFLDKGIKQDSDGCTVIYKYFRELESDIDFNQLLNFT